MLSQLSKTLFRRGPTLSSGSRLFSTEGIFSRPVYHDHHDEPEGSLIKTSLYDLHLEHGAKMVPFAGYELPVLYEGAGGGVKEEHLHTRAEGKASIFDVSHMGQIVFRGKDFVNFLSRVLVGDVSALAPGSAALSLITSPEGTIIDDCVVTRMAEEDAYYMVVNGANKHIDVEHFRQVMADSGLSPEMEIRFDEQLLALQGPGAMKVLAPLLPSSVDLRKVPFMSGFNATVAGIEGCRVTRCGYSGEDGFEIAVSPDQATKLARALLADENVKLAGLGARDSLRLEAGLCLHGNDISTFTTPSEAGLMWTIGGPKSARRREQGFIGASAFLKEDGKLKPVERKRVGLIGMKAPTRQGTVIQTPEGEPVGIVTSGTITPSLGKSIAMGYVKSEHAAAGTPLQVVLRRGAQDCEVTKMPFVTARYYRVPEEEQ
jgi:aminomethyltransferase